MSLLVLGLAGCTTYGDSYYRDGYYSDGGYYYPAEDGYGDYYQGREYIDYRYYDDYSYSPFWRLDRYSCGAFYSCSPYWNNYYRRPYSGWIISYGSGWGPGYGSWYGRHWSPWYGYGHYDRRPPRRDRDPRPPVVDPEPTDDGYSGTNPGVRLGRPGPRQIGGDPDVRRPGLGGGSRPPPPGADPGTGPRPGNLGQPAPGRFGPGTGGPRPGTGPRPRPGEDYVAPVPVRRAIDDNPVNRKGPVRAAPVPVGSRGAVPPAGVDRSSAPPRFERPAAPPPQVSRPAPPPPVERAPPPEVRPASQNQSRSDEQ